MWLAETALCAEEVDAFGDLRLDQIGAGEVAAFRASLVEKKLSEKRINNILAVLSKPMKCAVDCELITKSPKIGLYKVERPRSSRGTSSSTLVSSRLRRRKDRTGTRLRAWPVKRDCAAAK